MQFGMAEMHAVIWRRELDADATRWRASPRASPPEHFAPLAEELDREQRYPWENVRRLVEHKLAGLFIPEALWRRARASPRRRPWSEAIGAGCSSTAAILCVYQLGAFPVLLAGREDQKGILSRRDGEGRGDELRAVRARRRPDAAAIEATRNARGRGSWRAARREILIGNGGASRYYVRVCEDRPDAQVGAASSAFVDRQGSAGRRHRREFCDKLGIRGTQTSNLAARHL